MRLIDADRLLDYLKVEKAVNGWDYEESDERIVHIIEKFPQYSKDQCYHCDKYSEGEKFIYDVAWTVARIIAEDIPPRLNLLTTRMIKYGFLELDENTGELSVPARISDEITQRYYRRK